MIEVILIAAAAYAVSYILGRMGCWADRLDAIREEDREYARQLEEFDATYSPEPADVELARRCHEYLDGKFPAGVAATVSGMSRRQLQTLFEEIISDAADMMGVRLDTVDIYSTDREPECYYYGCYRHADRSLRINAAFIFCGREDMIREQISTIFHELKHGRQWTAVENFLEDGDTFGYSQELLRRWAENLSHYIPPTADDELYRKQPVEADAYGFEHAVMGDLS